MDGLEDRVRRALGAGALAADPSLVDVDAVHAGVAARRRRRLAVVSTAGVMALLAVGAVALNQQDNAKSSRVLTNPTPSATSDTRVPWLALPPPPAQPATSPSPRAAPTARECGGSDVAFAEMQPEGAAGTTYNAFMVTNRSASTCTLSSSPGISISGSAGGDVHHDSSIYGGVRPATIAPNERAWVALATSINCPGRPTTYRSIELILKDGTPVATHKDLESTCGVTVSDWYTEGQAEAEPYADLSASIEGAPLTVEPGTTLDYTVVLSNSGSTDLILPTPCPAYREFISDGPHTTDVSYGLNCAGWNGVIPAGGVVRLQMKLDIPAGVGSEFKTFWTINDPAHGLLLTTGLLDRYVAGPTPQPIATPSAQPEGTPQVTLYHCGVNPVVYDGVTWEVNDPPFDGTNAPATFSGFGQFVRDGNVLHFSDKAGATIDFTPDDAVVGPPCA